VSLIARVSHKVQLTRFMSGYQILVDRSNFECDVTAWIDFRVTGIVTKCTYQCGVICFYPGKISMVEKCALLYLLIHEYVLYIQLAVKYYFKNNGFKLVVKNSSQTRVKLEESSDSS
jgi:hypothetical protein